MTDHSRVVIAMSGGVDSSVAAALLVKQGYLVTGMMMRLWSEPGTEDFNRCCTPEALALARRVAALLDIPFYAIDAKDAFHAQVVTYFMDGYAQGITPNPCLACNQQIRWGFLLDYASTLGTQFLATGHYARLQPTESGDIQLLRAVDHHKDQSYVLHLLDQEQLAHTLLPLGELTKPQVRQMARDLGLPVADRTESQDLCFLGDGDYGDFLIRHAPQVKKPGPILDRSGETIGQHQGLAFFTIGQRKRLGIMAPYPLYVLEKDPLRNALIVGKKDEIGKSELFARDVNWIAGEPPSEPLHAQIKIRYKAHPALGAVMPLPGDRAHVLLDQSLHDITPGQAAVFYDGEICIGGGIIQ